MRHAPIFNALRATLVLALTLSVVAAAAPALAQDDEFSGRMQSMLKDSHTYLQQDQESDETAPVFGADVMRRVGNSWYSLIIPGWAQFRSGYNTRGAVFATFEVAIWTSYVVFTVQGNTRHGDAEDYARQFASASESGEDDDYWRAIGNFRSSREYNEDRRRDERVGLEPETPPYTDSQSWLWQSENSFDEYSLLRRDANSSDENADTVLLFAILNRLVSFVDAMRIDPGGGSSSGLLHAGPVRVDLDAAPMLSGASPMLSLSADF